MSYKYYIKNPMHMVERRLIKINCKTPHLINSLDRDVSHPLIGNHSETPFIIY